MAAVVVLSGCSDLNEERTRREVYKLAFRTAQFQEALERCDADPKVLAKHERVWRENFAAAAQWLDIDPGMIANRQEAGRNALDADTELGCEIVLKAVKVSLAAASRWADRIEEEEYCTPMGCE